jgi:hypothetical protein
MQDLFRARFQKYSNIELLKIIKRPDDYNPEAFSVAKEIIASRTITDEDNREAEIYFREIELKERAKREKIESYNKKLEDFLEPVIKPGSSIKAGKWLNLFLTLVAVQYLWYLFKAIKHFIQFYQYESLGFDLVMFSDYIILLYVPLVFYLLYKRKRWGWILLFADNLVSAFFLLCILPFQFVHNDTVRGNIASDLWTLFISIAFVAFLWREDIASYCGVDSMDKKKYAYRISILAVILSAGLLCLEFIG